MELVLDILQGTINAGAGALLLTAILGKVFPSDRVNSFAHNVGATLSKWGSKTINVAVWNVIELHIINTLDNINKGFAEGLKSDNEG